MATRKHVHEETFGVSSERLFAILHTPSAIRNWWGASRVVVLAEPNGLWAAAWGGDEDNPEYITAATITAFEPPRRMVLSDYLYRAKTGPLPFQAQFVTEFLVTLCAGGATLRVTQDGFPASLDADVYFAACKKGWADTFAGIRRFLTENQI